MVSSALAASNKVFNILVTTTTKSSAKYIEEFYKNKIIHQYIPFDVSLWCSRFLNFWNPNLILWIESDIWPNMLNKIRVKNINCLYLNARISPTSFKKWKSRKNFYRNSLKSFNKIFAQSKDDKKRIQELTNLQIDYIGNLKLAKNKNNSSINKDQSNTPMSNYFRVIIGSYKKEIFAYYQKWDLEKKGFKNSKVIQDKDKSSYLVSIESFKNKDEAINLKDSLKNSEYKNFYKTYFKLKDSEYTSSDSASNALKTVKAFVNWVEENRQN